MPIRPENRSRYPANWATEIRPAILARAGNRCERCKAPNGETIWRGEGQNEQGTYMLSDGEVYDADDGSHIGQARMSDYVGRFITVVLTIAHLDHQPENCDPDNLRAWCQRCHLAYDQQHHAETAAATRRAKKASGDLFA
jgi:hypothetical protein